MTCREVTLTIEIKIDLSGLCASFRSEYPDVTLSEEVIWEFLTEYNPILEPQYSIRFNSLPEIQRKNIIKLICLRKGSQE